MNNLDDHPLAVQGSWGEVRFFVSSNGGSVGREYFNGLSEVERRRFDLQFRKIATIGRLFNEDHYKKIEGIDAIYEFKTRNHRMMTMQWRRTWFLLNGFPKQSRKTPRREIERARNLKNEVIAMLDGRGLWP